MQIRWSMIEICDKGGGTARGYGIDEHARVTTQHHIHLLNVIRNGSAT